MISTSNRTAARQGLQRLETGMLLSIDASRMGHASGPQAMRARASLSGTSTLRTVMSSEPEARPQSCSVLSGGTRRPLWTALYQGSLKPSILQCTSGSALC